MWATRIIQLVNAIWILWAICFTFRKYVPFAVPVPSPVYEPIDDVYPCGTNKDKSQSPLSEECIARIRACREATSVDDWWARRMATTSCIITRKAVDHEFCRYYLDVEYHGEKDDNALVNRATQIMTDSILQISRDEAYPSQDAIDTAAHKTRWAEICMHTLRGSRPGKGPWPPTLVFHAQLIEKALADIHLFRATRKDL